MSAQHTPGTPLPWRAVHNSWERSSIYGPSDQLIAECSISSDVCEETQDEFEAIMDGDAEYIVRACNSFPVLLEALEELMSFHKGEGEYNFASLPDLERMNEADDAWYVVRGKIEAAIAKAKGDPS